MKVPVLLALGAAFVLGSVSVTHAKNRLFLYWPLVSGPSGYLGPFMSGRGPSFGQQQPRPRMYQAPARLQSRAYHDVDLGPGEPDADGRIGPTVQVERSADGKLLPTYHPR